MNCNQWRAVVEKVDEEEQISIKMSVSVQLVCTKILQQK